MFGAKPGEDSMRGVALLARGCTVRLEKKAREVLSGLPTDFPIVDTLEWVDQLIAAEPHKFTNPAGFYVYNLQGRATPPPSFESSRQRKAREEAQARADSEYYEKQQRELEYEEYSSTNLNSSPGLCLSLRSKSSLPSAARTLDSLRRRLRR